MIDFKMNMPFYYMVFYGSIMIIIVLLLRALLRNRLPKFVFPVLWSVILIRLLIPFSLGSPLSMKVPSFSFFPDESYFWETATADEAVSGNLSEDSPSVPAAEPQSAPAASSYDHESSVIEQTVVANGSSSGYSYLSDFNEHGPVPYRVILFLYFTGLAVTAGVLLYHKFRCTVRLKDSLLVEHNETVNALLREMDMGHILVFTNDEIASPLTCGLLAPHIYLPTRMDFADRNLLRHILLHETMHIKRRDNWIKAVMLAALILNWFNPLVWIMSRCFTSDLETACDEAVLRTCADEEDRKNYAFNLLAMAITGSRSTLLYSAFSKTEVEKRIQSILSYKKASAFLLLAAVCFITCSTVTFATCAQAPFSPYLTSYCASSLSRWGVKVYTTRDLTLGNDAQKRAEDIVFDVLRTDTENDPLRMDEQIRAALSNAFHVEKSAFRTDFFLCLDDEALEKEYAEWNLTRDPEGFYHYKGEAVRIFIDEIGGVFQSRSEGSVDITVIRDRFGYISDVRTRREDMPVTQAP